MRSHIGTRALDGSFSYQKYATSKNEPANRHRCATVPLDCDARSQTGRRVRREHFSSRGCGDVSCRTEHVQSCRRKKDVCPSSSPFPSSETPSTQPTPFHLPSISSPNSTLPSSINILAHLYTNPHHVDYSKRRLGTPPAHFHPAAYTLARKPPLSSYSIPLLARLMDRGPGRTDLRKSTRARSTGGRPSHRGTLFKRLPATGPLPKVSMSTWRLSCLTPPPAATREMTRTSSPKPCPMVHPRPHRRLLSAKTRRAKASP